METYSRKVISAEPVLDRHGERDTYQNKKGKKMYKTLITFEGGSQGVYDDESETQTYFKIGETVEFRYKQSEYGVKLYQASKGGGGKYNRPAGWVPKSPGEVKRDNISFSGEKAVKLMIEAKVPIEEFPKYLAIIQGAVNDEVDKIKDE